MSRRIGLLGGTFDPIHNGHLAMAQFALNALSLDEVQLIPNHQPPHKSGTNVNAQQRLEMVQLAIQGLKQLSVNPLELEQDRPSYSLYTLEQLRAQHLEDALFFIMGMDSFASLSSWHKWEELLTFSNLVVCKRPGDTLPEQGLEAELLAAHLAPLTSSSHSGKVILLENPNWPISSTQVRNALRQGETPAQWLAPAVTQYIHKQKLYFS